MDSAQAETVGKGFPLFMSAPRARFIKSFDEIESFLNWLVRSAIELDDAIRSIAKSDRRSGRRDYKTRRGLAIGAGARRKIFTYYKLLTEMALTRAIDSYLVYIAELLSMVFRAKPEALRSNEQITVDFVLSQSTRADLITALADRKVNQLAYQGMRELSKYLSTHLEFELFTDNASLERAILLIEIRNVIVHARGVVNHTFVRRVTAPPVELGKRIKLTINDVMGHMRFLSESVSDIEVRASKTFAIKLPYKVPRRANRMAAKR